MKHLANTESVRVETMVLDRCRKMAHEQGRTLMGMLRILITAGIDATATRKGK